MRHERFDRVDLRPAEGWLIELLRLWRDDDEAAAQLLLRDALGLQSATVPDDPAPGRRW